VGSLASLSHPRLNAERPSGAACGRPNSRKQEIYLFLGVPLSRPSAPAWGVVISYWERWRPRRLGGKRLINAGGGGRCGEDTAAEVKGRRSGGASLWSAVAEGAQRSARPATPLSQQREMREEGEVAASAKAVSALVPRSATALQKDAAAGRERWTGRRRFF
jgi:hypothetical protein